MSDERDGHAGATMPDNAATGSATADSAAAGEFERHRSVLFTLAYDLLGSAADADDVVQETWLRRQRVTEPVEHERALLCRIATRLALNVMRDAARRREEYVGPWLPEPIATTPDLLDDAVLAESVSQATLTLMETLSPDERAAFVLVEVFAFSAAEAGAMLARSAESVRQLVHRARERLREGRPHRGAGATMELWMAITAAIRAGDLAATMRLLTDDSVLVSDGGGVVSAARRPLHGADPIARFLLGLAAQHPEFTADLALLNGELAVIIRDRGELSSAIFIETAAPTAQREAVTTAGAPDATSVDDVTIPEMPDARILNVRIMRNPHKLGRVEVPVSLAR